MRVAIGSIMHESNTFTPALTDLDAFRQTQYLAGDEILRYHRGRPSEIGGMLAVLEAANVEVVPTVSALAMPHGVVTAGTYARLRAELLESIAGSAELDAVLLALHGSMTVEGLDDPEADLLKATRALLPAHVPLGATVDHHANVSGEMVAAADFLIGYRTHPHVDQFEVGREAAHLITQLIQGGPTLSRAFIKLPLLTPAENQTPPIRQLADVVRQLAEDQRVFTTSFFVGFPWADVTVLGASVLAITRDDPALARSCAVRLAETMWALRADFKFPMHPVGEALAEGALLPKPVVLDELSDCTLGGSAGDVVTTIRYLVDHRVANSIAVGIVDPVSADRAFSAGVGGAVALSLGGRVCTTGNPPLVMTGTVVATGIDVQGHGSIHAGYETRLGKVAVVDIEGVQVVIIERRGKIDGPTFLEALGIDPRTKDFIVVKEGLNPLETYKEIASTILMVESPGFDPQTLRAGDYHNAPRPMYPFDLDLSWKPGDVEVVV